METWLKIDLASFQNHLSTYYTSKPLKSARHIYSYSQNPSGKIFVIRPLHASMYLPEKKEKK